MDWRQSNQRTAELNKKTVRGFNVGFCAGLVLVLVRARSWNDRVRKGRRAPTSTDMSADYHPHHIYVARATTGAPILGEAAYARNRGQTSSAWLLMLVWHMPECCSCAIAHARQRGQLLRSGLHGSRLLVHLQHLGREIARIGSVCHVLCVSHDNGCAAVA